MIRRIRLWIDEHEADLARIGIFFEHLISSVLDGAQRVILRLLLVAVAVIIFWEILVRHVPGSGRDGRHDAALVPSHLHGRVETDGGQSPCPTGLAYPASAPRAESP